MAKPPWKTSSLIWSGSGPVSTWKEDHQYQVVYALKSKDQGFRSKSCHGLTFFFFFSIGLWIQTVAMTVLASSAAHDTQSLWTTPADSLWGGLLRGLNLSDLCDTSSQVCIEQCLWFQTITADNISLAPFLIMALTLSCAAEARRVTCFFTRKSAFFST